MKINEAKIIMFTLVTIILFCAVLIGYQIPKQQVKMKQNQIEDLQEEQRILRDKNGELNKLVKRQSKQLFLMKKNKYVKFLQILLNRCLK